MNPGTNDYVPSWSGEASQFEAYATACKWFQKATKESERKLIVARLWGRLTGVAKSVVRHLDPDSFEGDDGLNKFLEVLRRSPLQQLPISDSFSRLEKWNVLRRQERESIAELIIREEELFTDLQQSLTRARSDRVGTTFLSTGRGSTSPSGPDASPSQSPILGARRNTEGSQGSGQQDTSGNAPGSIATDFFSDEMRGYRLLKASRLTSNERQNILVQTGNSTQFFPIRRALRTLFAEDGERQPQRQGARIWWNDQQWHEEDDDWTVQEDVMWQEWSPTSWEGWTGNESAYWNDWTSQDWNDESWEEQAWWHDDGTAEDMIPDETAQEPDEARFREAVALAAEANRTMAEAREAVRKTRQARGYYSPESMSGKGMSPNSSSNKGFSKGKGSGSSGKGKGKSGFGPCFICGLRTHGYINCPDRFSIGKSKGKMKSFPGKGKKGKSKGKNMYSDIHMMNIWTIQWDDIATHGRSHTFAVLDTGATENAVGTDCLHDLVMTGGFSYSVHKDDLPTFRFGNGQRDQAVSRVDLQGTSLGNISFYVLGGTACSTPPLIGARTLREKNAKLSYANGLFIYQDEAGEPNTQRSVKMQPLQSGHVTINLTDSPVDPIKNDSDVFFQDPVDSKPEQAIMMVHCEKGLDDRLQCLAQRLSRLRRDHGQGEELRSQRRVEGEDVKDSGNSMRRPEARGVSMLWPSQECEEQVKSVCTLDNVREVCPSVELHVQGQDGGGLQTDGSGTSPDPVGLGGASSNSSPGLLHGEDCERQADGGQREVAADGSHPDNGDSYDPGRVPEEIAASWPSRSEAIGPSRRPSARHIRSDHYNSDGLSSQSPDIAAGERDVEKAVGGIIAATGEKTQEECSQAKGCTCEDGEGGWHKSTKRNSFCEQYTRGRGDCFVGGRAECGGDAGWPGQEVSGMWNALRGLQRRMRGDHTNTTMSPRLDVSHTSPGDATIQDTTKPLRIHENGLRTTRMSSLPIPRGRFQERWQLLERWF